MSGEEALRTMGGTRHAPGRPACTAVPGPCVPPLLALATVNRDGVAAGGQLARAVSGGAHGLRQSGAVQTRGSEWGRAQTELFTWSL